MTFLFHFDDNGASLNFPLSLNPSGVSAFLGPAPDSKEQQRNQGTETSENNA